MAIFNREYLEEKYVSKYAEYIKDMPDEEDEEEDDDDIDDEDAKELEAYYKSKGKEVPKTSKNKSSSDKKEEDKSNNKKEDEDKKKEPDKDKSKRSSYFSSLQKVGLDSSKNLYNHLNKDEIRKCVFIIATKLKDFPKLKKCCDFIDLSDREEINDDGEHESSFDKYYRSSPYSFIELINGDTLSGYPDSRNDSESFENDSRKFVRVVNDEFEAKKINARFLTNPNKDDDVVSFGIKSTKGKSE